MSRVPKTTDLLARRNALLHVRLELLERRESDQSATTHSAESLQSTSFASDEP